MAPPFRVRGPAAATITNVDLHPALEFDTIDGILVLTDPAAREQGVSVAFSTRAGGVSDGPYDSLNLSPATGDDPERVDVNRARVAGALGVGSVNLARQVHGVEVLECGAASGDLGEGDAVVTREPGVGVGVLTADCVPVLIVANDGVAAVHAGWRGIAAGVIPKALERLSDPIAAWVGPSIHACCYEVGPDVISAFEEQALPIADPWHVDPAVAAATQLRRAGIDRVAASSLCTSCDTRFFSHRRDRLTGRQGGFIALL